MFQSMIKRTVLLELPLMYPVLASIALGVSVTSMAALADNSPL